MPIKFYGTGAAAIVWDGVETINGQKTFSDTIIGDISSNGGTSYFTDICANRIYSNPDAGQALIIDSSLAIPDACFNILSNGDVGIGTTTPKAKLSVTGDFNFTNHNIFLGWNIYAGGGAWRYINSNSAFAGSIKFDNAGNFGFNTAGTGTAGNVVSLFQRLTILNNGKVGIGITTPVCPLHVNSYSGNTPQDSGVNWTYMYHDYTTTTGHANNSDPGTAIRDRASILASHNIVSKAYIVATNGSVGSSDSRIKNNIQDIDDSTALNILRQLKPKTYGYKDVVARGSDEVIGFIAQEVKELIPSAVKIDTQFLPNIYCLSTLGADGVVEFDTNKMITGDNITGRISLRDKNDGEQILEVGDYTVISTGIQVSKDISEYVGDNNEIFIYGQEVNDFHLLKKESVFTIATAALQEVDRQLQAEKAKTATLETTVADLVARIAALENA